MKTKEGGWEKKNIGLLQTRKIVLINDNLVKNTQAIVKYENQNGRIRNK